MAQFTLDYPVELSKAPARVELPMMFEGDAYADVIGAIVTDEGESVTLSGTVSAIVMCSDGTKVSRSGSASGNRAYVQLTSACYVPGIIRVYLNYTKDGNMTTLLEASGVVREV